MSSTDHIQTHRGPPSPGAGMPAHRATLPATAPLPQRPLYLTTAPAIILPSPIPFSTTQQAPLNRTLYYKQPLSPLQLYPPRLTIPDHNGYLTALPVRAAMM